MRFLPGLRWLLDLPARFDEALEWEDDPLLDRDDSGEGVLVGAWADSPLS